MVSLWIQSLIKHLKKQYDLQKKKSFQKTEEGRFPNSFYENNLTLIIKNWYIVEGKKTTDRHQIWKYKKE